jgi:hypothetical protein
MGNSCCGGAPPDAKPAPVPKQRPGPVAEAGWRHADGVTATLAAPPPPQPEPRFIDTRASVEHTVLETWYCKGPAERDALLRLLQGEQGLARVRGAPGCLYVECLTPHGSEAAGEVAVVLWQKWATPIHYFQDREQGSPGNKLLGLAQPLLDVGRPPSVLPLAIDANTVDNACPVRDQRPPLLVTPQPAALPGV